MTLLNLGCGTKVSAHAGVINIDSSIYVRLRKNPVLRQLTPFVISGVRLERFQDLPDNILAFDVTRGLPFPDDSVDAVYHSHMLEHLDRGAAGALMREVRRVLKPGATQRIVVPDLETVCRAYLSHIAVADADEAEAGRHDDCVGAIIGPCVRREAVGTSQQPPIRRFIENRLLGDARQQGDTHQWMYDRINLGALLSSSGYTGIRVVRFDESRIPHWQDYGLDTDRGGGEYKPGSLYVECQK